MTEKTTKEKIAVMQAYEDGKTIQQDYHGEWVDIDVPEWNWATSDYRVMPEPKLRPYKDAAEFLQAQKEHGLYIEIEQGMYIIPLNISTENRSVLVAYGKSPLTFSELVDKKWQDGTPCGIIEE